MNIDGLSGLELVIRVTILLGAGMVLGGLLRGRSASLRNLVWSASLGGALVLAVLVPWAPRLELPVKGLDAIDIAPFVRQNVPLVEQGTELLPADVTGRRDRPTNAGIKSTIAGGPATDASLLLPSWILLWAAGTVLILVWAIAGRLGLARLTRRARRVVDGPWHELVTRTAAELGVARRIAVYVSHDVGAPMTWGAARPVLLLPAESEAWSSALRRSVVAHEVAHVARNDYVSQLMAIAACAIYWFHPLAWMTARRLRQTAERACDDQVLGLGTTGEEYAAHLLGVARVSRELRLNGAVAIGMARPSTLEGRIVAVLDEGQRRSAPTSQIRTVTLCVALVLLAVVGLVRPVPVSGAGPVERALSMIPDDVTTVVAESPGPSTDREPPGVVQGRDSTIERSLSALSGGVLTLDLNTGGDVSVRGWDEPRVLVQARLAGTHWRDVELNVDRDSEGVRVETHFARRRGNHSTSNAFEILVPRRFDIRISSSGGTFRIAGVEGRFTGNTGGGGFVLEQLKGSARLSTGGGEITVSNSDLSGSVNTGGGTVRLSNVQGGLRGSSGSGPVIYGDSPDRGSRSTTDISSVTINSGGSRISVGRDAEYRGGTLNIEKAGGNVNLDGAPNGARIHTGGGDIRIGRSNGTVTASTGGGDVAVGPVAGSVRAVTGAGEVHIIIDKASNQVIEARSGFGRVIIELPRDFDGRLDLETAHTDTHEDRARIRSDWELERDPLTDWEAQAGTPRRYLRARAVLGRGEGRVVVRTVNGEIEIRRR